MYTTPLPHINVVNVVTLSKQSWVNCKPQETTLSGGEGELNILYPLVRHDTREKVWYSFVSTTFVHDCRY